MGNSLYVPNLKFELVLLAKGRVKNPTHTTGVSEAFSLCNQTPTCMQAQLYLYHQQNTLHILDVCNSHTHVGT